MKNFFKQTKGITLIALVITIIVLLILAGVTIAMLNGENGILSRAQDTKGTHAYYGAEEQVKLAYMTVKTEIVTEKTINSTYNAQNNAGKLAKIVLKELSGSDWTVKIGATTVTTATVDNTPGEKISITYTNPSIRAGQITASPAKPSENGKVEYEIGLLEQDATLKLDGVAANSGSGDSGNGGSGSGNTSSIPGITDPDTGELLVAWDGITSVGDTTNDSGTQYDLSNGLSIAMKGTALYRVWDSTLRRYMGR